MIGPSAVGKTTLYDKIERTLKSNEELLTLKGAYKKAALQAEIFANEWLLFCYQNALRSGLFKNKERGLGRVILTKKYNMKSLKKNGFGKFLVSFDIQHQDSREYRDPIFVQKMLSRFLSRVEDHLLLELSLRTDKILLVDEGMIHYHTGITDYALETYTGEELKRDPVFSPAGIIHCVQEEEVIYEQAQKRKEEGVKTFSHGGLNSKELRQLIKKNILYDKEKAERLKNIGIPVLDINTGEDFEVNLNKIVSFASDLKNSV